MRFTSLFLVSISVMLITVCCNQDFIPVGDMMLSDLNLSTKREIAPAFTFQEKLDKVQTNGLPLVQLGTINHPVFGKAEASFVTQLSIGNNPFFGDHRQRFEEEENPSDINLIPENEKVTSVVLEIPFFYNQNDADNDGVIDSFDTDPQDPQSNSDSDELSDLVEFQSGLNPLSPDSDGDGILDHADDDNSGYDADNKVYDIDSIYGNRNASFDLKIYELNYFLNALDPSTNFETTQAYYSSQDFYEQGFVGEQLLDQRITLNFEELRFNYKEDDPETPDVDETTKIETRLSPRIRVPLNTDFFQKNLIDLEDEDVLRNDAAFREMLRGIIIKAENFSEDLYMLLDINNANITVFYEYDDYNTNGTPQDITDDSILKSEKEFVISLNGIRVNTLKNSLFDAAVEQRIEASKSNQPTDRLYIQSGSLYGKIRLFSSENQDENSLINNLRTKNWLLNEANLSFYIDPNTNFPQDLIALRLYLYKFNTGQALLDYQNDGSVSNFGVNSNKKIFGGTLEYDDFGKPFRYKFNLTSHISNIIRNDSLNVDLGLVVTANINDPSLVKGVNPSLTKDIFFPLSATLNPLGTLLIGSHPETTLEDKKVKLELIYSDF
ncbi:MAG: DUF4270 domain-containing protein [Flavobacteriaceae bacterium]